MAIRVSVLVAALVVLALASDDEPRLRVRAHPRISIAPAGTGCSPVLITAELKGPESERFYCPRIVFTRPDGTTSSQESDCPPFAEREEYPRIWRHRVCAPPHPHGMNWTVLVQLYRGGEVIKGGFAEASFLVR